MRFDNHSEGAVVVVRGEGPAAVTIACGAWRSSEAWNRRRAGTGSGSSPRSSGSRTTRRVPDPGLMVKAQLTWEHGYAAARELLSRPAKLVSAAGRCRWSPVGRPVRRPGPVTSPRVRRAPLWVAGAWSPARHISTGPSAPLVDGRFVVSGPPHPREPVTPPRGQPVRSPSTKPRSGPDM
ncbi:hypothetical protein F3K43_48825 [Streptomyces sp. LBUM 1476]|nr:hypothetical protein [Streptomyces sp. LBUM 1476]